MLDFYMKRLQRDNINQKANVRSVVIVNTFECSLIVHSSAVIVAALGEEARRSFRLCNFSRNKKSTLFCTFIVVQHICKIIESHKCSNSLLKIVHTLHMLY